MSSAHPTRVVEFTMLATLIGVAIPLAISSLVDAYSLGLLVATVGFLLTSINFFHGKVVTLENEDYNIALTDRPALAVADYALNLLVVLSLVFLAFSLSNPMTLILAALATRGIDLMLVLVAQRIAVDESIGRAQRYWFAIDLGAFGFWLLFVGFCGIDGLRLLPTAVGFAAFNVLDIVLDYTLNQQMYFSVGDDWGQVASLWDWTQGEYGDVYRQHVVVPAVLSAAGGLTHRRVLDVGAGNGCVARSLARAGATVVAVDNSEEMLEAAEARPHDRVSYFHYDLDRRADGVIDGGAFDIAVACFVLQDCATLARPFEVIARNLRDEGQCFLIYENEYSFNESKSHVGTTRRWLDLRKKPGRGRRQLAVWEPARLRSVRVPEAGDDGHHEDWSKSFTTITRQWSDQEYLQAACKAGLLQVDGPRDLAMSYRTEGLSDQLRGVLVRYLRHPRFRMATFVRMRECESGGQ